MNRMISVVIIIFLFFNLTSCTNTPQKSSNASERGFPIHGEFCGPNIPTLKTQGINDRYAEIESIQAIDSIDDACKKHDVCYMDNGYYDESCDKKLIDDIGNILQFYLDKKNDVFDTSCTALAAGIIDYFRITNPSRSGIEEYADSIASSIMVQGSNIWMSSGTSFYKGYASLAIVIYSPALLVLGVTPAEIKDMATAPLTENGMFDYYPSRFKKCP